MYLKAYSRIALANGEILKHQVVEFADDGTPLSYFALKGELPFVEWYDETFYFSKK